MKPYTDKELARLDAYVRNNGSAEGFVRDKARKKPDNEESRHQKAVVKWFRMNCYKYGEEPRALFSIPNGGLRDKVTSKILKDEGAVRGVPDLFLASARYRVGNGEPDTAHWEYGLFIEMKTTKGIASKDQVEVHAMLLKNGYAVVVCHSFDEAKTRIMNYLTR